MDIELRLREVMTAEDPGVQVTEAVMSRVGEHDVPQYVGAGITRISDARARRRRFILVGAFVALAAAAGMLMVEQGGKVPPASSTLAVAKPAVPAPDMATAPAPVTALPVPEVVAPAPEQPIAHVADFSDLPLLPYQPMRSTEPNLDMILQKAVERHSELVEGPAVQGEHDMFFVALVMRTNGAVLDSAARLARPEESRAISAELNRMLPRDVGYGSTPGNGQRARGTRLSDGRALRANVALNYLFVPDRYDISRSSVKVDQLMRTRHAELFLPSKDADINRVIVLLTADGNIDREKVMRVKAADGAIVSAADIQALGLNGPEALTRLGERMTSLMAERIASQLGISVDQIGAIGNLTVEDGSAVMLEDANGVMRRDDQRRVFKVLYAWPRREGETAPSMGEAQINVPVSAQAIQKDLDKHANQLIIAERVAPDAFTRRNSDAGTPVIALDASGKVIGTMRLNTREGEHVPSRATIRELQQLDARFGKGASAFSTEILKNKSGATAEVVFAWVEVPVQPGQGK